MWKENHIMILNTHACKHQYTIKRNEKFNLYACTCTSNLYILSSIPKPYLY